MDKFAVTIVLGSILLIGGIVLVSSRNPTSQAAVGTEVTIQGDDHIAVGADHPAYNSNPPTSGWHYATPADEGIYPEPIVDEAAVHALEHGRVWVTYRPDQVDEATRDTLESTVRPFLTKALLSPRPVNDQAIAATSWGRIQTWDIWNETTRAELKLFLERNRDRGPERIP